MTAEGRPHRAKRPTSRVPSTLTSSEPGPSNGGIRTGLAASKGKGKRKANPEEECKAEGTKETDEPDEEVGKTKGKGRVAKAKSSTEKLYDIDFILTNPKSRLTGMDIPDVINYGAWLALSTESRASLCKLLPRAAFGEQSQELDRSHPSRRSLQGNSPSTSYKFDDSVQTDGHVGSSDELAPVQEQHLDPSFFKDPHFESAARTFQDHLFSGWFTTAHQELVRKHHSGVRDGSLYAPWKDDIWDQDHPEEDHIETNEEGSMHDPSDSIGTRNERRKSKESEFSPLVRKGFLKQGDIISFRHKFLGCGLAIEKDALISAIHPKTSALTLTTSSGTTRDLPSALLIPNPNGPADLSSLREMHVSTPTQLITALLDIDGRIPREHRPRINPWKMLTNWQWSVEMESQGISSEEAMLLEKGGRECLGTLFYLRGQALDD